MLRRFVALGQVFQRVVYYEDAPEDPIEGEEQAAEPATQPSEPAGGRGFLTVELRGGREPLFPFSVTPAPRSPDNDRARSVP